MKSNDAAAPRRSDRPPKGDTRQEALLAAADALLQQGRFSDASVATLAEAAGISRAAFYFYFASKEALLATVLDRAIRGFNDRIATILDPATVTDAAAAIRASVEAAGELWWQHNAVLCASFELGTRIPEVYERTQKNLAIVQGPTSILLRRVGRVPEAADPKEAAALVLVLIQSAERVLYDLMRGRPTRKQLKSTTDRLARLWLRAFGLEA